MINKNQIRRRLNHKIRKIKQKYKFNLDGTKSNFTRTDAIKKYFNLNTSVNIHLNS